VRQAGNRVLQPSQTIFRGTRAFKEFGGLTRGGTFGYPFTRTSNNPFSGWKSLLEGLPYALRLWVLIGKCFAGYPQRAPTESVLIEHFHGEMVLKIGA
jgi:hypothetical protein